MKGLRTLDWLKERKLQLQRTEALKKAVLNFSSLHPDWAAACFDEHFLLVHALPLGEGTLEGLAKVSPEELAEAWFAHIRLSPASRQWWLGDLIKAAADFLGLYNAELQGSAQVLDADLQAVSV